MHKSFSVLVLVVGGFWGASQAMADPVPASICDAVAGNLVANCGFETGDFTSWTISGNTGGNPPGGTIYGVDGFDTNSGNDGAYMSQSFSGGTPTAPIDLSQTLVTTVGFMYDVTYYLDQDTPPEVGDGTHAFSSAFGSTTMQTLTPTVASPGPNGLPPSFTEYSFAERRRRRARSSNSPLRTTIITGRSTMSRWW
jgi:hypothetical protein